MVVMATTSASTSPIGLSAGAPTGTSTMAVVVVVMATTSASNGLSTGAPTGSSTMVVVVVVVMVVVLAPGGLTSNGLSAGHPTATATVMPVVTSGSTPCQVVVTVTTRLTTMVTMGRHHRLQNEDGREDEESKSMELHDGFLGEEGSKRQIQKEGVCVG